MSEAVILLVEDNPDDVELTVRALTRNKIANEIVVARDGVEALDYLFGTGEFAERDITHLPHLILLDLNLPRLNGHEVLTRLREDERFDGVPIVIFTTSDEEKDMVEGYRHRANSYVCKPVDFAKFSETIKELGMYWLVLNQSTCRPRR